MKSLRRTVVCRMLSETFSRVSQWQLGDDDDEEDTDGNSWSEDKTRGKEKCKLVATTDDHLPKRGSLCVWVMIGSMMKSWRDEYFHQKLYLSSWRDPLLVNAECTNVDVEEVQRQSSWTKEEEILLCHVKLPDITFSWTPKARLSRTVLPSYTADWLLVQTLGQERQMYTQVCAQQLRNLMLELSSLSTAQLSCCVMRCEYAPKDATKLKKLLQNRTNS